MLGGAAPGQIYISACSGGIAQFASLSVSPPGKQYLAAHCDSWPQRSHGWAGALTRLNGVDNLPTRGRAHPAFARRCSNRWNTCAPASTVASDPASGTVNGGGKVQCADGQELRLQQTGNIMIASTEAKGPISQAATALFEEVAVFFAAMTKAITTTPKPGATQPYAPTDFYTIYDYDALEGIVNGSGLFVNVNREDLQYARQSVTITFNLEFIEAVLGIVLTDGIGAGPLLATLNAMGKQATFSYTATQTYQKIGNLLFVCEYLLGLPLVTVLYFYLDETDVETVVSASPCIKVSASAITINIHKDSFMFVPPAWIREYGGDLASVQGDQTYQQLVLQLQSLITTAPLIVTVAPAATYSFPIGTQVTLTGVNFGTAVGRVLIGGVTQTVTAAAWTNTSVAFTTVNTTPGGGTPMDITGPIVLVTSGDVAG